MRWDGGLPAPGCPAARMRYTCVGCGCGKECKGRTGRPQRGQEYTRRTHRFRTVSSAVPHATCHMPHAAISAAIMYVKMFGDCVKGHNDNPTVRSFLQYSTMRGTERRAIACRSDRSGERCWHEGSRHRSCHNMAAGGVCSAYRHVQRRPRDPSAAAAWRWRRQQCWQ